MSESKTRCLYKGDKGHNIKSIFLFGTQHPRVKWGEMCETLGSSFHFTRLTLFHTQGYGGEIA